MAILSVNTPYVDGGTVTSTNLNELVTDATFVAGATDNVTTELSSGAIIVKDNGVSINKLNTSLSGIIELDGNAYIGCDKQGNARGNLSIDIQAKRGNATQVASGADSFIIGANNTVSGGDSEAFGRNNTVSNGESTAIGYANTVGGYQSSAFGRRNTIVNPSGTITGSNYSQVAFGTLNKIEQYGCTAVGYGVEIGSNSSQGTLEIGSWGNQQADRINSSVNGCSLRMHKNGQVAFTMTNGTNAPTDGGSTDGNEASGTLPRKMFTIAQNDGEITLYYNDDGNISSLTLGTLS